MWPGAVPELAPLRWANQLLHRIALVFEQHGGTAPLRFDEPALPLIFLLLLAHACARILIWPARSSITPLLVPNAALANAITWNTSTFEIATVAGPALGGFLIAFTGTPSVYVLGAALELFFLAAEVLGNLRVIPDVGRLELSADLFKPGSFDIEVKDTPVDPAPGGQDRREGRPAG